MVDRNNSMLIVIYDLSVGRGNCLRNISGILLFDVGLGEEMKLNVW